MAEKKSNIMEIIQGISQAAANAYDGASDENGDPLKVGLMREEGHPILDTRVMDGFGVCFSGNKLRIKYQGEVTLKEVYKGDFEGDIVSRLGDIVSFLKKEYKKITGNGLTLTKLKDSEPQVLVQSMSKIRSWVQAQQDYVIGGIPEEPHLGHTVEERLTDSVKKWIGYGKDKFPNTKKPENVSGKRDLEPPEKKKLAEGIDRKKLARAFKIIQEELTIDGRKMTAAKEKYIMSLAQKDPKLKGILKFAARGKKMGGGDKASSPGMQALTEPSKVDKALDKAVEPEALAKMAAKPEVAKAVKADAVKAKEVAAKAAQAAKKSGDEKAKKVAVIAKKLAKAKLDVEATFQIALKAVEAMEPTGGYVGEKTPPDLKNKFGIASDAHNDAKKIVDDLMNQVRAIAGMEPLFSPSGKRKEKKKPKPFKPTPSKYGGAGGGSILDKVRKGMKK